MSRTRFRAAVAAALALPLLTACAAGASPPPPPPSGATSAEARPLQADDVDAWLDGFVPAALDREGVPGATVAVVSDGKVLTTRGFGWADRDERIPVDPDKTLFRVGSVSKVFTATAVMQLVEQGDVDLDADVAEYVDVEVERPVSLRQLLSHTGGFEESVKGLIRGPDETVDLEEVLTTDPPEQVYEPGTTPAYSNYGNALAGLVVQEVSGMPFEQYVSERVLQSAGMTSSSFAQPLEPALADRLAKGYPGATGPASAFEVVGTPPAGALTSSAPDMAAFMLAHLGQGADLLEPDALEQMHAPALDESTLGGLAAGQRMTLGFFDRSRNGRRALEHGGDTTVFHADLELWPDDGVGVFVAMNGSGREGLSTARLRDGLLDAFADRYLPGEDRSTPTADEASRDRAAALAGTYETSRTIRSNFLALAFATGQTTIEDDGEGRVVLTPGPTTGEPTEYAEVEPWLWREVGGSRTLAARVEDGRVQAVGFDNAFALLPVGTSRQASVVLPVVGGSALVLVLAVVTWLAAGPVRWLRKAPRPGRRGRAVRVLTRVGVGSAVLALVGWVLVVSQVMALGAPPSATTIRVVQVLQLLGLLAVVPATAWLVARVRDRAGLLRVAGAAVVVLALGGLGWAATTFHLLGADITY